MFLSKAYIFSFVGATLVSNSIQQEFPPAGNEWQAPGDGDVRSPCPFINTLANHGLINRNGKDVDLFEMVTILSETFDNAPPLFQFLSDLAVTLNLTSVDEDGIVRMDIDALFAHNKEEHDASFVRSDFYFGEEESKLVDLDLLDALLSVNPDSDVLTREDLMTFQTSRILDSRANNPEVNINEGQATVFSAQATLFLTLGQDPDLVSVQKERIDELLRYERLPQGYVPQAVNGTLVAFDVLAEGTVAADARLEFVTSFEAALAAEIPAMVDETTNAPSAAMMDETSGASKKMLYYASIGSLAAAFVCT